MGHPLLHRAGGAVLRRPDRQLRVMVPQQVGQELGVLGVILGAAGHEGFAIFLEGDGIDGMERDPGVSFQERNQVDGGLFETEADAGGGLLLAQLGQPFAQCFGRGVNGDAPALAGGGVEEAQIGFFCRRDPGQ